MNYTHAKKIPLWHERKSTTEGRKEMEGKRYSFGLNLIEVHTRLR